MNHLLRPVALVALGIAVVALALGQPAIAVLGFAAWVGTVAYSSVKHTAAQRHDSAISTEGRSLLRPLRDHREQIAKIVESFGDRPEISVIGGETLKEADALLEHTGRLVEVHDQLVKALRGRTEAEHDINVIEKKIDSAEEGPVKDALVSDAAARQREMVRYERLEQTRQGIVAKVKEAETALFEIKAKLSAGAVGAKSDDLEQDELEGMVGRLKSLSTSFDEAEEMMENRIR